VPLPFEQLCWDETPMGVLGLRRRTDPTLGAEVYEVKLGDEYLMSSHFTVAEVALATLGLAPLEGDWLEVVVGGLGLGYTARAVLEDPRVGSLVVVEALPEVIAWHEQGLLPDVAQVFAHAAAEVVTFDNPLAGGTSANTIYLARAPEPGCAGGVS
jgi:hypothetical protein